MDIYVYSRTLKTPHQDLILNIYEINGKIMNFSAL